MSNFKTIRVGIIGAGNWGQFHARAYARIPEAEIVGIASRSREKAESLAKKHHAIWYTDYSKLLKRDDVDAVSICTPTNTHAKLAVETAQGGKHVLCEKPMAMSIEEANEIITAARKANVRLMLGHVLRFSPECAKAKDLIDRGEIGDIIMASDHMYGRGLILDAPDSWKGMQAASGGGVFIEVGIHSVDLLRWLIGSEIQSVYAKMGTYVHKVEVEDNGIIFLEFENGSYATILQCWSTPGVIGRSTQLIGKKGILLLLPTYDSSYPLKGLKLGRKKWENIKIIEGEKLKAKWTLLDTLELEVREFLESIIQDREPAVTGEDGKAALQAVLAAYESVKKGKPIAL